MFKLLRDGYECVFPNLHVSHMLIIPFHMKFGNSFVTLLCIATFASLDDSFVCAIFQCQMCLCFPFGGQNLEISTLLFFHKKSGGLVLGDLHALLHYLFRPSNFFVVEEICKTFLMHFSNA